MYKLLAAGQLKAFKNGRVWRISKKALEEFVLQQSKMAH
jgi:excisionase family DNA binding protein